MASGNNQKDNNEPSQLGSSWIKLLILALAVAIALTAIYESPLRYYLSLDHLRDASDRIHSFGAKGPIVLSLSVAVLVAVGLPRLFFCLIAGTALGFWSGLLWAQLGTLIGNYIFFLLVRATDPAWAERILAKRGNLREVILERGVSGVIIARQLPFPGLVINLVCALLPLRQIPFLLGTIIGQLPQAIPVTLIGAGILQPSLKKSISVIGLAVVAAILSWIGLRYLLRRRS
jgi:uncharacterized membrane protein YdjX (TVP38/TMEM64 family)